MTDFETMLTGGHPNSLGRTVEVVDTVLADHSRLADLFACYRSDDPVVRLRVSNALKRVEVERHDWLVPLIDQLIDEVGALDQDSAQWTLAQLFLRLTPDMTPEQRAAAEALLKRNLESREDWIVLNFTMETLVVWAKADPVLTMWLKPHLNRLIHDPRKSVAARAQRFLTALT